MLIANICNPMNLGDWTMRIRDMIKYCGKHQPSSVEEYIHLLYPHT